MITSSVLNDLSYVLYIASGDKSTLTKRPVFGEYYSNYVDVFPYSDRSRTIETRLPDNLSDGIVWARCKKLLCKSLFYLAPKQFFGRDGINSEVNYKKTGIVRWNWFFHEVPPISAVSSTMPVGRVECFGPSFVISVYNGQLNHY